jgi:hypothetical protein
MEIETFKLDWLDQITSLYKIMLIVCKKAIWVNKLYSS